MRMQQSSLGLEAADREQCALFDLQRATRALTVMYNARLRGTDLTIAQFTLLRNVSFLAPARYTRIAQAMLMDRTSVTRVLEPLFKRGFLTLIPEQDRRVKSVTLTAAGRKAMLVGEKAWLTAQRDLKDVVGESKLLEMRRAVRDVIHLVRDSEDFSEVEAETAH